MRDFTLKTYELLLLAIRKANYTFQTFEDFIDLPDKRVVVLRHDSDKWPDNDLKLAEIENSLNIKASYFFRVPATYKKEIINQIIALGHEIGYHYEDLVTSNGDFKIAIELFETNLFKLRELYPVKTIVMHGRPLSKWDSRDMWKKFDFRDYGIKAEPYMSIDYNNVLYFTDNGSRWDGDESNIRDIVSTNYYFNVRTTFHLIEGFNKNIFPDKIIINAHAERWNDDYKTWLYSYSLQKLKNLIKRYLKKIR